VPAVKDESGAVRALYEAMIEGWNKQDAAAMAAVFSDDASVVGFDGSQLNGRPEIESSLREIFEHHAVAPYTVKIREVRFLGTEVAIVRAIAGMARPGKYELNPALNAIQTLVAAKIAGTWQAVLFQNTPAAFHGRPELTAQLTEELRASQ